MYCLDKKYNPQFVMLNDVKSEDTAKLFASYTRFLNNPYSSSKITAAEQSVTMPENIWFVVELAEGQKIEDMPSYMIELSTVLNIEFEECELANEFTVQSKMNMYQLNHLVEISKSKFEMKEDLWKKVDRIEDYVRARTSQHISNKLCLRMERYMSVFCACDFDLLVAFDNGMATNIVPFLIAVLSGNLGEEDRSLIKTIELYFGEDNVSACRKAVELLTTEETREE